MTKPVVLGGATEVGAVFELLQDSRQFVSFGEPLYSVSVTVTDVATQDTFVRFKSLLVQCTPPTIGD